MEDEEVDQGDGLLNSQALQREEEVKKLLKLNDTKGALLRAIQDPPNTAKTPLIKEKSAGVVDSVLAVVAESSIDAILAELSGDQSDILLKYIYRLLASAAIPSSSSAAAPQTLLRWHEKIIGRAGPGSIIRALADRKSLL